MLQDWTLLHVPLVKLVRAWITIGVLVGPEIVKPNCPFIIPKLPLVVLIGGFHNTAGTPPKVIPQPVVPAK
jgi:hypothetical protein